jgi:purine-binding chemotaxis protein CheW
VTDAQSILEARARALARPLSEDPEIGEQLELLTFAMDGARYAVEARHVIEVIPLRPPTPVPCVPPFVLGLLNHRGRVLPAFDLGLVLGTGRGEAHAAVVAVEVGELRFGVAIEAVEGVASYEAARLSDAAHYVRRVAGEPLTVLDLEALAADGRLDLDDRNGDQGGRQS